MPTNITVIGGGAGTYNVLYGLKKHHEYNLAAVVTMSDDGGSAGILRDEFGVLPPGDVRRAILALSKDTINNRKLFEYRFKKESSVGGHTIGNLLLTALTDIHGNFGKAIQKMCELFDARGKVFPVTMEDVELCVELSNGEILERCESIICDHEGKDSLTIKKVYLKGDAPINFHAKEAILNSDYIIFGPGGLFYSIIPNLLVEGVQEAIVSSNAKKIYVCNIMTHPVETRGFQVLDFINNLEAYLGENILDYVLVNNGHIGDELVEKYKQIENKKPVKVKNMSEFEGKAYKIVEKDLLNESDFIRHDPEKLGMAITDIVEGWVK